MEHLRERSAAGSAARRALVAQLATLAQQVRPLTLATQDLLPVPEPLAPLLPGGGLRRGSVVQVQGAPGAGATSVAVALLGAVSASGSWVALVDVPAVGLRAVASYGVSLERLVVLDPPAPVWAGALAAAVDGFDAVVVGRARAAAPALHRVLARARERGAVLVTLGAWPVPADVAIGVRSGVWQGIGAGCGLLRGRRLDLRATGRAAAARPRRVSVWLPAPEGGVRAVATAPAVPGSGERTGGAAGLAGARERYRQVG